MTPNSDSQPTPPPPDPPSQLRVDCPNCSQAFAILPPMLGQTVGCPHCQEPVSLPKAQNARETDTSGLVPPAGASPVPPPPPGTVPPPPGTVPPPPRSGPGDIPTLNPSASPPIAAEERPALSAPPIEDAPTEDAPPRTNAPHGNDAPPIEPIRDATESTGPTPISQESGPKAAKLRDEAAVSRAMDQPVGPSKDKRARSADSQSQPAKPTAPAEQPAKAKSKSKQRQKAPSKKSNQKTPSEKPASAPASTGDELPLLPPGVSTPTASTPDDELLPPTSPSEADNSAGANSPTEPPLSAAADDPTLRSPDDVRLPDGKGGYIVASSRSVTMQDGERVIQLQRLDRKTQNERRSLASMIVFGICIVTLVVAIIVLRSLFGG